MLQGFGDAVLQAEALEDQLVKSRKHAVAMQAKLDAAFAKYHNDIQELQAKGDDLVRKNKGLRNKNKGTTVARLSKKRRMYLRRVSPCSCLIMARSM
jgi:predicted  nucleic acid-binding Zn-ribbon protein